MKLRILSLISVCFLFHINIFSQWVQTNGPYSSVNAFAFFTNDSLKVLTTNGKVS
jgi:hypothetical protein